MAITQVSLTGAADGVVEGTLPEGRGVLSYFGFTMYAATATAVLFESADSEGGNAVLLDYVSLAAGESAREFYPGGIDLPPGYGVKLSVVSGEITSGALRVEV